MHSFHVVVWLDHTEAHVIHFNRDESQADIIKSGSKPHLHVRASGGSGRSAAENRAYLDQVVSAVKDAQAILIVGPGSEKTVLYKHMVKVHPEVAEKVASVDVTSRITSYDWTSSRAERSLASARVMFSDAVMKESNHHGIHGPHLG